MAGNRAHSRVTDDLPAEIRREVDRLLVEDNSTYDDIANFLKVKGYDISRSSIGRYGMEFVGRYQKLKIIEDQAKTLVAEAGENVMVLEEAASKMFGEQILSGLIDRTIDVKEIPRLVSDFAKLQASTVLRERMKMDFAKKVEKTATEVVKVAREGGLSPEKVDQIKRKILGIV
jgi:hypothetical protein